MTNVSKRRLPEKEFDKLFTQLNQVIASLDQSMANIFFTELLGPEEKIMLTKRFAAVAMFIEGNSSYRVKQLLKLSPTTSEAIRRDYESGRYDGIKRLLTQRQADYEQFWQTLDAILRLGMPPMGRGRWKSVFDNLSK